MADAGRLPAERRARSAARWWSDGGWGWRALTLVASRLDLSREERER